MTDLLERIGRALADDKRWWKATLAAKLGVGRRTVGHWAVGHHPPPPARWEAMLALLKERRGDIDKITSELERRIRDDDKRRRKHP